jgi:hypothetical protein
MCFDEPKPESAKGHFTTSLSGRKLKSTGAAAAASGAKGRDHIALRKRKPYDLSQ